MLLHRFAAEAVEQSGERLVVEASSAMWDFAARSRLASCRISSDRGIVKPC